MSGREEEEESKHLSAVGFHWWLRLFGWEGVVCSQVPGEFVDGSVWEVSRNKNTNTNSNDLHLKRKPDSCPTSDTCDFFPEMCSFEYDSLRSFTMCPTAHIWPSSMLHISRVHILLLFYISNRSC